MSPGSAWTTRGIWRRRLAIAVGGLVLVTLALFAVVPPVFEALANPVGARPPYSPDERAAMLHRQLLVADLHADSLLWNRDLAHRSSRGHVDLPRLRDGNVAIQAFTTVIQTPRGMNIEANTADTDNIALLAFLERWPARTWTSLLERALYQAGKLHDLAARSDGGFVVLRTAEDLERLLVERPQNPRTVAGFLGIEGAHALEGNLANLDVLFDAGFRMLGLTHFFDNAVGGSAHGVGRGGLTPLGRQVVERAEQLGILVDLAHASPALVEAVLDVATRPVVVSHTGVKGTCDNRRNLDDRALRRIAGNGGVVGIGFWPTAACGNDAAAIARAIRYAVELMGEDHVALGSDFDGVVEPPFDASGVGLITEALLDLGLEERTIHRVMGENVRDLLLASLPRSEPPATANEEIP